MIELMDEFSAFLAEFSSWWMALYIRPELEAEIERLCEEHSNRGLRD